MLVLQGELQGGFQERIWEGSQGDASKEESEPFFDPIRLVSESAQQIFQLGNPPQGKVDVLQNQPAMKSITIKKKRSLTLQIGQCS